MKINRLATKPAASRAQARLRAAAARLLAVDCILLRDRVFHECFNLDASCLMRRVRERKQERKNTHLDDMTNALPLSPALLQVQLSGDRSERQEREERSRRQWRDLRVSHLLSATCHLFSNTHQQHTS